MFFTKVMKSSYQVALPQRLALPQRTLATVMCTLLLIFASALAMSAVTTQDEKHNLHETLNQVNAMFKNMQVEVIDWPDEALPKLGNIKPSAFVAFPKQSKEGKRPLLISLHGGGGKKWSIAQQLARSAKVKGLALAEKANQDLILFAPNSSQSWDPATLNYALSLFLKRYPQVDEHRIYLMGHSMGGTGTLAWSIQNPDLFAAVSPSGFRLKDENLAVENLLDVPIWLAVGSEDGVRPQDVMSLYLELKKLGNKQAGFTAFPGANHAQANAAVFNSEDLVEWFLSHSKRK